jgi:5,10-methylenetetrahydromethanopterin reductase
MTLMSYGMMVYYPAAQAVEQIVLADRLGFHGAYLADDPTARDPWLICAAAARETERIRLGFSATHVYLREPTFIAQALATLDELSNGRAEAVVSYGDQSVLRLYGIDPKGKRPLARVREAIDVMRRYLDEGAVDHDGEFFHYSGLVAGARPVQARLPLLIGAVGGPRSFQLAGEVGDGVHCVGVSRANSEFVVEHVAAGAERAGRDYRELDMAAACITCVAEDASVAREAARAVVAGWLPSLPRNCVERHGLDYDEVAPIIEASHRGDTQQAIRLTTPEITEALSIAGTPAECAERIRRDIVEAGIGHVLLALVDQAVVDVYGGPRFDDLPDTSRQLELVRDQLLPLVEPVNDIT